MFRIHIRIIIGFYLCIIIVQYEVLFSVLNANNFNFIFNIFIGLYFLLSIFYCNSIVLFLGLLIFTLLLLGAHDSLIALYASV